ncbi:MAG: TIGR03619 family F420-dependent LLM class oxidoreductase, partial [Acidimicrobiia bacterium]|nr:TIGR03619 family F420-dependent LLM class oxidoreductase [Acidimicrobiia bacterium]MCY4433718.1 TIGR03619 family F420-dependent LLM class oxidoreductase [bacterium]
MTALISINLRTFAAADPGPGGWQPVLDLAKAADAAGVDKVVVSDHVVFGENLEAYGEPGLGGMAGGRQPTGPDGHWLEPTTVLTALGAITSNLRLGNNILLAALRRPVILAKSLATLDVLTGGRVDLGVGVGWQAEEYEAAGLDFAERGAQLDHTLAVCQALWGSCPADFSDDQLEFSRIYMQPQPVQPGGVPVWVSGTVNHRAMRRLARFGAGWIPWGDYMGGDMASHIDQMREAVAGFDRDSSGIGVVGTLPIVRTDDGVDLAATMDSVPALVEAGVTDFRAHLPIPSDAAEAHDYLAEVVTAFRPAAGR